ncbi:GHKL domain-containing protein [Vibrio sp. OCN044]|uniref:histidine kinase n=1 Tax=Vibrio tetraodonis subsp. pristinus TaxID=2695891 RepID=A0A6L8M2Y7_9VIBR|nr:sensor histidine kinase [Vibrio tetraodonis]MYM61670.1 GHKL domain-containing protein [Vibrio tetraodonis subsp. pristinus]
MVSVRDEKNFVEFRVSAKTARLIGRESISSAEGAIIELVKNSYDADAPECQIFVISEYETIPDYLDLANFESLTNSIEESEKELKESLSTSYTYSDIDQSYVINSKINATQRSQLESIFLKKNFIVIADSGDGMTSDVIRNHWMTIGTDAKEVEAVSSKGRVKSGAKGIGRFALDKLGKVCEVRTAKENSQPCIWKVNWDDFEGKSTLDQVKATLEEVDFSFSESLENFTNVREHLYKEEVKSGTIICISDLREFWPKSKISKLFENLKSLLPPSEESDFKISLKSNIHDGFGELTYDDYNEFDWKLSAEVINGRVKITYFPSEYDRDNFDYDFFKERNYLEEPLFSKDEFNKGLYIREYELDKLIPTQDNNLEFKKTLDNLGDLSFSAYFLKKTTSSEEKEKYHYRNINYALRNKWLDLNGGVKIYRDNMRVRPYGLGSHFDWLKLDERAASSPAAPLRKGQWRVRAHQLAGVANISRLNNLGILDQTNREGLIENDYLVVFKNVLVSLVKELEYHRSFVAYILDILYRKKNKEQELLERSKGIIKDHKPKAKSETEDQTDLFNDNSPDSTDDEEKIDILVQHAKIQDEKIDNLTEENKLLRVLASSGAMIASFAHDFKKMSNNLSSRHKKLVLALNKLELDTSGVQPAINPFLMIEDMEKQDDKLNAWLKLTLDTLKQDRRKSKIVDLDDYFSILNKFWEAHLSSKNAKLKFEVPVNSRIKCFEIELDAIFNNLISNSYEAFKRLGFQGDKVISISVVREKNNLDIIYSDTGPGLSNSISSSSKIFEPLFTTKTDSQGNTIGTGLGMSLVKGSVEDLNGTVNVLTKPGESGFSLKLSLPTKV